MAKAKGQVPLDILEDRYQRLGNIIKRRGGNTGSGPGPQAFARKAPKGKKGGKK